MPTVMGRLIDAVERALFGATAQETVEMRIQLATRRLEDRIIAALESDDDADDADDDADGDGHEDSEKASEHDDA